MQVCSEMRQSVAVGFLVATISKPVVPEGAQAALPTRMFQPQANSPRASPAAGRARRPPQETSLAQLLISKWMPPGVGRALDIVFLLGVGDGSTFSQLQHVCML